MSMPRWCAPVRWLASALLAALLLTPPAVASAQGRWSVAAELPSERAQMAAVAADGKIYVTTGASADAAATGMHQEFDPVAGTWRELPPMPDIASHAGAAVLDGRIYVVGGFVANVHVGAMARVFEYDIAAGSWRALAPLAVSRGSAGVVALDGKIHAIGGRDEGMLDAHEVYDPATNQWTAAAPLPLARDHLGIAAVEGRIHVFGGRTGGQTDNTGRHDIYDPVTDTWSAGPPLPTPRSGGATFRLADLLVYVGGECRPTQPRSTFPEVQAYDMVSGQWITLPSLPEGRHATAAATVGDTGYVIGGRTGCGGDGPTLEVLSFSRS